MVLKLFSKLMIIRSGAELLQLKGPNPFKDNHPYPQRTPCWHKLPTFDAAEFLKDSLSTLRA